MALDLIGLQAATTIGCGVSAAFLHWAGVITRARRVPPGKLIAEMTATFVVGAGVERGLDWVSHGALDVMSKAIGACIVGFAYGPTALLLAARYGVQKYIPDAPAPPPLDPPDPPAPPSVTPGGDGRA
ncbi:hypothetical protein GCM10008959_26360 [Deinococcus seoulensis]|uniref:Uncharacterized protein n=1 Tax=Deinococcus seoulensis TaxID=1837379 RepID=A0ABQ2RT20_9DEIO|nr:hypothetical protein [Deinococcus seoulensis]GGR62995.1 hypothetical protein GCM10008959_26360 [Deinococcus seoulensis]